MKNQRELLSLYEEKVRAGDDAWVSHQLQNLDASKISREFRLGFANLCRRIGLISTGLKILSPLIYQNGHRRKGEATIAEQAEYAVLLQRTGAVQEALRILQGLDKSKFPQAGLLQSFCHFNRWEYAQSLPLLRTYLNSPLEAYQALIGRVNLAAALIITNQMEEAEDLLQQNISLAREQGHLRLLGNCHELKTQIHVTRGDWSKARLDLEMARNLFAGTSGLDIFFVQKWQAILESLETKQSQKMQKFFEIAKQQRDWESLREAMLFSLKAEFQKPQSDHLYFGTPFAPYRERIQHLLGFSPTTESYLIGGSGSQGMDLESGKIIGINLPSPTEKIHQVLEVLLRDFYRPLSLGGLFSEVFPEEHFDVFSSANRVHQLIWRTRSWLQENKVPVHIVEDQGHFSIQLSEDFYFRVSLNRETPTRETARVQKLARHYPNHQFFTSSEASLCLGMSISSFKRFAAKGIEQGYLRKAGAGSGTLYQIAA